MRLFRSIAMLALALALPAAALTRPAPHSGKGVAVKPLDFTERTLANGLRVYAIRDTATPNVSVQMWYDVGSKDDPRGRSGFAHMFEHLMFKATRNLKSEQFDRLTEDVGGYNNASTDDDYTNYFEVVPASQLERLLFAEADRMANLAVTADVFASERHVVQEELRSRVLASPYGRLFYLYMPMTGFQHSPYARPGIGSIEDLDAASIEDIRAFHATYYRPDNAVLVVAGNFDPDELNAWVDKYFAPIKGPATAIPRVDDREPLRDAPVGYTTYAPNVPLPAVLISYVLPPADSPDIPALDVLNAVLSSGDNSRLHQALVYHQQIAQDAGAFFDSKHGAGTAAIYAIMADGKSVADGEAALKAEIARLIATPVGQAELDEAKNQILTGAIQGRETAEGKAFTLAQAVIVNGDPRAADREIAAIQKVTAADVQRVAALYLADKRAATIRYLSDAAKPADAQGDVIAVSTKVVTAPLAPPPGMVDVVPADDKDRVPLPPAGKTVDIALPTPVEMRLANGLRVVVVERHALPLVTASMLVTGGGTADPAGRAGLASFTADLMTKGTTTRSATQIAQAIESLGGSIGGSAGWDGSSIDLSVKSDVIVPALGILADVVRNPAFADDEIARQRAQDIDSVALELKDPGDLSRLAAMRTVFGDTPYGHRLGGTPASLAAITAQDIKASHAANWQPERATLMLVGDITADRAKALAEQMFGDWKGSVPPAPVPAAAGAPPAARIVVIDLPGTGQAGVVVAKPGLARTDPAFYPTMVANSVLGGGYSARLNQEIRIKRGLAYGASSALVTRRMAGPFYAATQTKNPSAPEVVALITGEFDRIATQPIPDAELETRKANLIGDFGRGIETNGGIAGTLALYVEYGLPFTELRDFIGKVNAVDSASASAAAARLMGSKGASIVVVGDAAQFLDALRKDHPDLVVIPAAKVNLDSPSLQ